MPAVLQFAQNAASATSLTVTLGAPTTGGSTDCLVALYGDSADTTNATVSGITLGGLADNWAQKAVEGTGADHAIAAGWADPGCAAGKTSVVISTTGGTGDHLFGTVLECSSLSGTLDVSSGSANSFSSTWTSGATAATSQASAMAFGITCGAANVSPGTSAGLTGPASPWTNEAQQQLSGATHEKAALSGYQVLSSTGTVTYNGTASPQNTNDTLVFVLKAASVPASTSGLLMASII